MLILDFMCVAMQASTIIHTQMVSEEVVGFSGSAVDYTSHLVRVVRGGQVVLSERAWDAVKNILNHHPGAAQVCV